MEQAPSEELATFVVIRSLNDYRDAVRSYIVLLDGKRVGKVRPGEKVAVTLAPGRHVVQARIDWTGSPEVAFTVSAGGQASFAVGAAGGPFRLDQIFGKGRYLTLEQTD